MLRPYCGEWRRSTSYPIGSCVARSRRFGWRDKMIWIPGTRSCPSTNKGDTSKSGRMGGASRFAWIPSNRERRIGSFCAKLGRALPRAATLTLVAGPNGSGKSSLTQAIADEFAGPVVDPDAFAKRRSPDRPSAAAIAGARDAIEQCRSLLSRRQSFVVETTLAGHGAVSLLTRAREAGYRTRLVYICCGDVELHIERVRVRAEKGRHDISDSDIRRRYERSMMRAPQAMRLADETLVLDNSGNEPLRALMIRKGRVVWRADVIPAWVQTLVQRLE